MIKEEREIKSRAEIESVIERAWVCRLALAGDDYPYIVPLCFGYKDNALYFHSGPKGRKLELLAKNSKVCFEFDVDTDVKPAQKACNWGMKYQSVIGFGEASFIEDLDEKRRSLDIIMEHYSGGDAFEYPENALKTIVVFKVDIHHITGKQAE